ncbi:pyridoxamine 5'-phosphate oxidase family protein [Nocardia tengchongensis]|uniref:Pyridoxamine 5'-phosphate oxidase family protein n=1 Tax=Nocardia tengchongensis TaxID=2055889 RepID=A0ABX8CSB8_9NOCA|nr:pyridoxamine 5'-phosphate oxidase family protein [Nocardia tengchongensis]QVI21420.1 pyridoxamine 5'-phosphate oxidase family protein [Nocardia tengchongensis]
MSEPDFPPELADIVAGLELAFLVSIGDLGPHTTPQHPVLRDGRFHIATPGPATCRNIAARPAVTLLWPPTQPDGHVLIIDGHAALRGNALEVIPTHAVFHHVGAPEAMTRRCADCRRFTLAPPYVLTGADNQNP